MKRKKDKPKDPMWARLLLAVLTLFNIVLAIVLKVINRQEVLKLLDDGENMKVVTSAKTQTKTLELPEKQGK